MRILTFKACKNMVSGLSQSECSSLKTVTFAEEIICKSTQGYTLGRNQKVYKYSTSTIERYLSKV